MSWVLIVFMSRMLEKSFRVSSKTDLDIKTAASALFTFSHNVLALLITSLFIRLLFHGNDLDNWADWKWHLDNFLFLQKKKQKNRTDPLLVTPNFGLCSWSWSSRSNKIRVTSSGCHVKYASLTFILNADDDRKSILWFYFVFEWFPIEFWIPSSMRRFFSSQKICNKIQFTTSTTNCIW